MPGAGAQHLEAAEMGAEQHTTSCLSQGRLHILQSVHHDPEIPQPVGQQEQPVEQDAGEGEQMAEHFTSGGGPPEHATEELARSAARAT